MLKFPQNFVHIRTYGITYAICENAKKTQKTITYFQGTLQQSPDLIISDILKLALCRKL